MNILVLNGSPKGERSNTLPAVMGVFTVWFEKWYPGHYAAGR